MSGAPEMPVAGEFVSASGLKVTVRVATFAQMLALATATDAATTMTASARLVDACASVDGLDPAIPPTAALTVEDCRRVAKLAQGDGSDFG